MLTTKAYQITTLRQIKASKPFFCAITTASMSRPHFISNYHMSFNTAKITRQYYLDWIRNISILLVFFFHGGRFFDSDDWHIKNAVSYPLADVILFLLKGWMMPLFFFISGASSWFALAYKSSDKFLTDRVTRILVPLLFGIFILSPPQVYLERISHHQFIGSFWRFIPAFFSGFYGFGGNFAWMGLHLWYLLLLFIFSCLTLPLLIWWKNKPSPTIKFPLLVVSLFIILLSLPDFTLPLDNLLVNRSFGGWGMAEHLITFVAGYYAYGRLDMQEFANKFRFLFLTIAIMATVINLFLYINHMVYDFGSFGYCLKIVLRSLVCFSSIFTIIGYTSIRYNFTNCYLDFYNQAGLPFYIAHQPIMICVGYCVIQLSINPFMKYLVIVSISFMLVLVVLAYVVKRNSVLRFLFGMGKTRKIIPAFNE